MVWVDPAALFMNIPMPLICLDQLHFFLLVEEHLISNIGNLVAAVIWHLLQVPIPSLTISGSRLHLFPCKLSQLQHNACEYNMILNWPFWSGTFISLNRTYVYACNTGNTVTVYSFGNQNLTSITTVPTTYPPRHVIWLYFFIAFFWRDAIVFSIGTNTYMAVAELSTLSYTSPTIWLWNPTSQSFSLFQVCNKMISKFYPFQEFTRCNGIFPLVSMVLFGFFFDLWKDVSNL